MTETRSRRDHAAPHFPAPQTPLNRARAALADGPARRAAVVSSALALTLVAGFAVATTVGSEEPTDSAALAALGLEIDAGRAAEEPVVVPEDAEWTLERPDAEASVHKDDIPTLREAQAASRAAERQAIEAAAAEERARQQAQAQAEAEAEVEAQASQQAQAQERAEPRAPERSAAASAPAVNAAQGGERGALTAMLNGYRRNNGLPALGRDGTLDAVAQNWAQWMATNQVLQHNPSYRSQIGSGWIAAGENIVRNTGGASMSPDAITSWMFGWWQNSAPHRANMLNTRYTHVGVGYYMGAGGPYAVFLFGGR